MGRVWYIHRVTGAGTSSDGCEASRDPQPPSHWHDAAALKFSSGMTSVQVRLSSRALNATEGNKPRRCVVVQVVLALREVNQMERKMWSSS
jgi:hypothetical protein